MFQVQVYQYHLIKPTIDLALVGSNYKCNYFYNYDSVTAIKEANKYFAIELSKQQKQLYINSKIIYQFFFKA